VTPFSLFDDGDEEEEEEEEEEELKTMVAVTSPSPLRRVVPVTGSNPKPSALLSERLQVGEISLIPTDPTYVHFRLQKFQSFLDVN